MKVNYSMVVPYAFMAATHLALSLGAAKHLIRALAARYFNSANSKLGLPTPPVVNQSTLRECVEIADIVLHHFGFLISVSVVAIMSASHNIASGTHSHREGSWLPVITGGVAIAVLLCWTTVLQFGGSITRYRVKWWLLTAGGVAYPLVVSVLHGIEAD